MRRLAFLGLFRLGWLLLRRRRRGLILIGRFRPRWPGGRDELVAALYFAPGAALGQEINIDQLATVYLNLARTLHRAAVLGPGRSYFIGVRAIGIESW